MERRSALPWLFVKRNWTPQIRTHVTPAAGPQSQPESRISLARLLFGARLG